jgi:hypothetical protein
MSFEEAKRQNTRFFVPLGMTKSAFRRLSTGFYSERKSSSIHPHPSPLPSRGREFKEGITFLLRVINENNQDIQVLNA